MSHSKYNKLSINGKIYQASELIQFCKSNIKNPQTKAWEILVFKFILEWLDDEESLSVKTSGSTGEAKQIQLKKQHMINSAKATAKALNLKTNQTALLALSADYIAGKMMIIRSMVCDLNLIVVEPKGNPLENIDKKIDFAAFVPFQLSSILKSKTCCKKLQQIENVLIGGGAIDESLVKIISSFPNKFYSSYGMTETSTHIALRKLNGSSADKYYRVLPNVKISLDERLCLVIDADHLSEKQLITNDLATLISPSEFIIDGRHDHIINSGGIKISPETIEGKLKNIIQDNFIITSVEDPQLGEKIILLIERDETDLEKLYDLWGKIDLVLDPYEIPKQIDFINPFIYTPSGKIDRTLTRKSYLSKK